jgi:DNA-binding transcriptional LysR family regulator
MDRLTAMSTFVRCVERGSFSAVAREMHITQPTVSKLIASLERHLGGRLFVRSTRQLTVTAEGRRYYAHCRTMLDALDAAKASFRTGREEIAGPLHIAASVSFGRTQLMSRMPAFMQRYPSLSIDLQLSDRFVELVEDGVDVAFRVGELKDSSLIARKVGTTRRVTVGAPEYLRRRGEPRRPEDLATHDCIVYTGLASLDRWHYTRDGHSHAVRVAGSFQSNSGEAVREATLAGIGISLSPMWLVGEDIRARRVKVVLADYLAKPVPIHALSPANRRYSAKVKACVDFFQSEFEGDPFVSASPGRAGATHLRSR